MTPPPPPHLLCDYVIYSHPLNTLKQFLLDMKNKTYAEEISRASRQETIFLNEMKKKLGLNTPKKGGIGIFY